MNAHLATSGAASSYSRRAVVLDRPGADAFRRAARVLAPIVATVVFAVVLFAGGAPSPYLQLPYIPIILAAYAGGVRLGLTYGIACAVAFNPLLTWLDLEHNGEALGVAWIVRGTMFIAVGVLLGWLFARSRAMSAAWEETVREVTVRHREGMLALAHAAEAKDTITGDHMFRCRDLAAALARETGLSEPVAGEIGWSAMLHDIGKLYVPDLVLTKPGALTTDEWALIRAHPVRGAELLQHVPSFDTARRIARWHHENLDGSGYPDGLRGSAIPLEARIVRVVDSWDAMTNDRPYRPALRIEDALAELRRCRNTQFDPELVELFVTMIEREAIGTAVATSGASALVAHRVVGLPAMP